MLMSYVLAAAGLCFALGMMRTCYCFTELLHHEHTQLSIIHVKTAYAAMIVVCRVIESATQTTLICLAEDPQTLARTKPQLYDEIKLVYPQIQWQV